MIAQLLRDKISIVSFTNLLKYLKDSPSFIILFITTIGGIWQLIQLSNISLSYIRFFSISQLIPDGLILTIGLMIFISLIFCGCYLSLGLLLVVEDTFTKNFKKKITNSINTISHNSLLYFLSQLLIFLIPLITTGLCLHYYNKYEEIIYIICNLSVLIFTIIIVYLIELKIINDSLKDEIKGMKVLLVIGIVVIFFTMTYYFNKFYLIPDNLKNYEVAVLKLKKENPKKAIKILYFNDKYLFIKITDYYKPKVKREKIEIIDFTTIPTKQ